MKYLFVGGDYNGEWLELDHATPEVRLPGKAKAPWPTMYDRRTEISVSTVSYKREKFADLDGKEYIVYFGTNPAQPLRMLIEGYGGTKA